MRARAIALLMAVFFLAGGGTCLAATLEEVLKGRGVDTTGLGRERLARRITSFASLDAADVFLIAYYTEEGSGRLADSLHIDLQQKREARWIACELRRDESQGVIFGGSVLEIIRSGGFLYLHTHVNPSASYTLVLRAELEYHASLNGWPLAVFPDGLLIFQNSQVHFAPTHYTEISVFDPRTKRTWLAYPRRPYQPVRLAHIAKVRAAYEKRGEKWFREHQHHGNPELFDNYRRGEAPANSATRAVAFRIAFDNTDTWEYAEKLAFERFGGLARGLQDVTISPRPAESAYGLLGDWLNHTRRGNMQNEFLALFKGAPALEEMLHQALEMGDRPEETWQHRFASLDPRWENPEVWQKLREVLAAPPETTDVIVILRNLDREENVECREILASDYEKRFGDLPLEEVLTPAHLRQLFQN